MNRLNQVVALTLALIFLSCASNVKDSDNPEVIYNETVRLIEEESWVEARELIDEISKRFPQSRYAVLALLRKADVYFGEENFIEAAAAYQIFVELHPNHEEAAYAQYRLLRSRVSETPDEIARDQDAAAKAVQAADHLIRRYAASKFVSEAKELRMQSRLQLARKEAYVAEYYARRDFEQAAYLRWKVIVDSYQDLSISEEGAKLLEEARVAVASWEGRARDIPAQEEI